MPVLLVAAAPVSGPASFPLSEADFSTCQLRSKVVQTDNAPVPVLDPAAELPRTRTGRIWTYVGDAAHPYMVSDYTPNRSRAGPDEFLASSGEFVGNCRA
jgi:hypothetical protein